MTTVNPLEQEVETVRRYAVSDADVMNPAYRPGEFRPEYVAVKFIDGILRSIIVRGPMLRKNGHPGKQSGEWVFYQHPGEDTPIPYNTPDWLRPLAEFEQPDPAAPGGPGDHSAPAAPRA